MDLLKLEIEKKRKLLESAKEKLGQSKYIKRGQLDKLRDQEYWERNRPTDPVVVNEIKVTPSPEKNKELLVDLDEKQIVARLRSKGLPIRLFGETNHERLQRLKAIDSLEDRDSEVRLSSLFKENEKDLAEEAVKDQAAKDQEAKYPVEINEATSIDTSAISKVLFKNDPQYACSLIVIYFKKLHAEWDRFLQMRSDDEKRSQNGRLASVLFNQTTEHLKPLYKKLKKNVLEDDVMNNIVEICYYLQLREYIKANDAYNRLAIGNAAWPVGVVNVGIVY
jgi:pre-mRNA-splicing factor 18